MVGIIRESTVITNYKALRNCFKWPAVSRSPKAVFISLIYLPSANGLFVFLLYWLECTVHSSIISIALVHSRYPVKWWNDSIFGFSTHNDTLILHAGPVHFSGVKKLTISISSQYTSIIYIILFSHDITYISCYNIDIANIPQHNSLRTSRSSPRR